MNNEENEDRLERQAVRAIEMMRAESFRLDRHADRLATLRERATDQEAPEGTRPSRYQVPGDAEVAEIHEEDRPTILRHDWTGRATEALTTPTHQNVDRALRELAIQGADRDGGHGTTSRAMFAALVSLTGPATSRKSPETHEAALLAVGLAQSGMWRATTEDAWNAIAGAGLSRALREIEQYLEPRGQEDAGRTPVRAQMPGGERRATTRRVCALRCAAVLADWGDADDHRLIEQARRERWEEDEAMVADHGMLSSGVIAHLQAGTALTDIERARLQVAAREVTTKHEEPREMDDVLIGRMRRRIRTWQTGHTWEYQEKMTDYEIQELLDLTAERGHAMLAVIQIATGERGPQHDAVADAITVAAVGAINAAYRNAAIAMTTRAEGNPWRNTAGRLAAVARSMTDALPDDIWSEDCRERIAEADLKRYGTTLRTGGSG